ncbi:hypothetical protein [Tessaracoccus sp.]
MTSQETNPSAPDFTMTLAGLGPGDSFNRRTRMTLHRVGCSVLARANHANQDYLHGWVLDADGRAVDHGEGAEWRDDEVAIGFRAAGNLPVTYASTEAARVARARMHASNGHPVCGRCHPETALKLPARTAPATTSV